MKKKEEQFAPQVDFKELTPDILLKNKKSDPLYEKAFLSKDAKCVSEYAQNTTSQD